MHQQRLKRYNAYNITKTKD